MSIQKAANTSQRKMAMGGEVYENGGEVPESYLDLINKNRIYPNNNFAFNPNSPKTNIDGTVNQSAIDNILRKTTPSYSVADNTSSSVDTPSTSTDFGFTTGDYIGMAGSLFSSIAPLVNTNSAARATKPNMNRYKGFGQRAIDSNDTAQGYVAGLKSDALSDIDTEGNSAIERNRNGASSINTSRALDIATTAGVNKAKTDINNSFAQQMIALLGQRGQLTNAQDTYEGYGQLEADQRNAQDVDNYYSNRATNIAGIGTNIEALGRNFNISHSNKVDANLLSQLSEYGLMIDENGNLVNKQ